MSHVTRKLSLGVCDQVRLKPVCLESQAAQRLNFEYAATSVVILSRK